MRPHQSQSERRPRRFRVKVVLALSAGLLALIAPAIGVWHGLTPDRPEPVRAASAEEIAQNLRTDALKDLSDAERRAKLAECGQGLSAMRNRDRKNLMQQPGVLATLLQMSDADLERLVAPMRRAALRGTARRMDAFFTATPERQEAMLDATLDTIERHKGLVAAAMQNKTLRKQIPVQMSSAGPQDQLTHLSHLHEATSPADRARLSEYRRRLETRAKQRGVKLPAVYP